MLNPAKWSVGVWRAFGALVCGLDALFMVAVFILVALGQADAAQPALKCIVGPIAILNFLFLWLVVGSEEGYLKGFLIALAFIGAVVAGSTLLTYHAR